MHKAAIQDVKSPTSYCFLVTLSPRYVMLNHQQLHIRKGLPEDMVQVYELVEQQATHHEVALKEVKNTPESLREDAFGEESFFKFLVAEQNDEILGTAIYYLTYSTWKGKSIYLEDLIVHEKARGMGIGQHLFEALVKEAARLGVAKLNWQVAEDNKGAIRFYERFDTGFDEDWINCSLSQSKIQKINTALQEKDLALA